MLNINHGTIVDAKVVVQPQPLIELLGGMDVKTKQYESVSAEQNEGEHVLRLYCRRCKAPFGR